MIHEIDKELAPLKTEVNEKNRIAKENNVKLKNNDLWV